MRLKQENSIVMGIIKRQVSPRVGAKIKMQTRKDKLKNGQVQVDIGSDKSNRHDNRSGCDEPVGPVGVNENKPGRQPDDPERNTLHRLGTGFEFLGVLALAAWLGYKADKRFDSAPTLMIFFFITAFVTMIYLMIKGTFGWKK